VPPSSWGPYTTTEAPGGIGRWSALLWLVLGGGGIFAAAGAAVVLVNWQAIFSKGD
jgi:hypothetical protein